MKNPSPDLNFTFLQILPTVAFLSSSGLITWIPQTVYFTSEHIRRYFLVFFCFTLFSCWFREAGPILSVFFALIVHSELKSVHPGFPVAFIF